MRKFKVVGPCTVAGVPPGDEVTESVLEQWNANVDALLGVHLEEVSDTSSKTKTTKGGGK